MYVFLCFFIRFLDRYRAEVLHSLHPKPFFLSFFLVFFKDQRAAPFFFVSFISTRLFYCVFHRLCIYKRALFIADLYMGKKYLYYCTQTNDSYMLLWAKKNHAMVYNVTPWTSTETQHIYCNCTEMWSLTPLKKNKNVSITLLPNRNVFLSRMDDVHLPFNCDKTWHPKKVRKNDVLLSVYVAPCVCYSVEEKERKAGDMGVKKAG